MLEKDFYEKLPFFVRNILDDLIEKYSKEEWFENAWNEYRNHCLKAKCRNDINMPSCVFDKYIKEIK